MIHEIKDKLPIGGVMDNTKNNDGRPKDGIPKDTRPKKNTNQLPEKELPNTAHCKPLTPLQTKVEEPINP